MIVSPILMLEIFDKLLYELLTLINMNFFYSNSFGRVQIERIDKAKYQILCNKPLDTTKHL